MPGTYFLIDGHSYIYSSFFGMPELTNAEGKQVQAAYALTALLFRIRDELRPERWAIALDTPAPTFRHGIFPEYKANRPEMPFALQEQLPWIEEILAGQRIPVLRRDGFEADDLIATATAAALRLGYEVRIVSRDKDLEQLLSERVQIWDPKSGRLFGPEQLHAKKGILPARVVEYLALTGDASDNVPGVRGVGAKTAVKVLSAVSDVEELLADPPPAGLSAAIVNKIRAGADTLRLSRRLVTLRRDAPLDGTVEEHRLAPPEDAVLRPVFERLGFRRFLEELPAASVQAPERPRYELVTSGARLAAWLTRCREKGRFAFDTETTGLDPIVDRAVGFSLAIEEGEACYVPLLRRGGESSLPRAEILAQLAPLLADPEIGKIAQNSKFDLQVMRNEGIRVEGLAFDPMLAAYLLNPERRAYGLDGLAAELLHHRMIPIDEVLGGAPSLAEIEPRRICDYAAEDADYTLRLAQRLAPEIESRGLARVLYELELPLVPVLVDMEREGITLDGAILGELEAEVAREARHLEQRIHEAAGVEFNVNSPKQLQEILFGQQRLEPVRRTKTGYSTSAAALEELAQRYPGHPLPALVLDYRSLSKLLGTYLQALPRLVKPATGRIHTDYSQTAAATGRLSSSEPNLQNIPIKREVGRKIRRAFVPNRRDDLFLSADYSQIELRLLAHLSGDSRLLDAMRSGIDIHRQVAAAIHGKAAAAVTAAERRQAKAINFGVIYGMGAFGLSQGLGIDRRAAQSFIDAFFHEYPAVREFMDGVIAEARSRGEVRTLYGRRRAITELDSRTPHRRAQAERFAVNTVVQGSAADLIKKAMVDLYREQRRGGIAGVILLQIHDELLFEVPRAAVESDGRRIRERMTEAVELQVPLEVHLSSGENWFDATK